MERDLSQTDFIKYQASGVAALLRTRALAVPIYQRSYSWITNSKDSDSADSQFDKQQVVEFWDDLRSSFNNRQSYFLGTVVLAEADGSTSGRELVIDGQQRLATASLLLAAIRDRYEAGGESAAANSTQQEYLGRYDKTAKKDLPKLILNTDDRDFYERHVILGEAVEPQNHSQALIGAAYGYLKSKVEEFTSAHGAAWEEKLTELEDWLDNSVQVVAIVVATQADAFLIFETLNDRGADLSVADLLKNFLFSQAGQRLDEVQLNWAATLSNLGLEKIGNQLFTTFARHLLSSKYGLIREREVYGKLKSIIKTPADAVTFTLELRDSARLYYALMRSDSDYWSDFPTNVANAADVIAELKIERYRPLVLAVLGTFEKRQAERFILALVGWSVRMLAAGQLGGGVAESAFCEAAVEVRARRVTTPEEILAKTKVGGLVPSDPLFESSFAEWRVTAKLSRYLLRALELEHRGETEPELVVNADVDSVNLEHILPRNAKDGDWPNFTPDDRRRLVERIGNHALLQRGANSRIGNKPWSAKRPVLEKSKLLLTSATATNADWTEGVIESRQKALAQLAVSTWPRAPRI